jgi:hypothetical protein
VKHIAVPFTLVMATLAGCSSQAKQAQPPAPIGPRSMTQLQAMTLKLADLPYGWAPSPPSTDVSVTGSCAAINSTGTQAMPAHTEADYEQSEEGPFAQEFVSSGSAEQVQAAWRSFRAEANQCSPSPHLSPESFPSYGDASYALRLTVVESGVPVSGDVILIRTGQVLVELVFFGNGGVPTPLVQQVIGLSLAKI